MLRIIVAALFAEKSLPKSIMDRIEPEDETLLMSIDKASSTDLKQSSSKRFVRYLLRNYTDDAELFFAKYQMIDSCALQLEELEALGEHLAVVEQLQAGKDKGSDMLTATM